MLLDEPLERLGFLGRDVLIGVREGAIFSSTSDTEVVLHGVARSRLPVREAVPQVLTGTEGAFSMLFLTPTELIAIRDSRGFRPLALGRLGDAWVLASETGCPAVTSDTAPTMAAYHDGTASTSTPRSPNASAACCSWTVNALSDALIATAAPASESLASDTADSGWNEPRGRRCVCGSVPNAPR